MERVENTATQRFEDTSNATAWILGILAVLCIAAAAIFKIDWLAPIGLVGLAVAFVLAGIYVVQSPEMAIIERFGKFVRKKGPGLGWKWPFAEQIRAALSTWEQAVAILIETGITVDFKDGTAKPIAAFVYCRIIGDKAEAAVYELRDWRSWVRNIISPLIRGFHNGFSVTEALDEGAVRGNLLKRISESPDTTKRKIQGIDTLIVACQGKGKNSTTIIEQLEIKKAELQESLAIFGKIKDELDKFLAEAKDKGVEILRVVVGEYELSPAAVVARERVIQERREAEAARYTAQAEAIMRSEPILAVRRALVGGGVSPEVAEQAAISFEILQSFKGMGLNLSVFQLPGGHPIAGLLAKIYPSLFGGIGGAGEKEAK